MLIVSDQYCPECNENLYNLCSNCVKNSNVAVSIYYCMNIYYLSNIELSKLKSKKYNCIPYFKTEDVIECALKKYEKKIKLVIIYL